MGRGPTTAAGLAAVLALVATTAATGRQAVPPDLAARARTFVAHEAAGEWAAVRGMGDTRLAALPDARLKEPWTSVVDRAGPLVREEEAVRTESIAGATVYVVTCRFARGTVEFSLGFDTDSRVSQTSARPVGDFPPAYSVAAAFTERRVTVGGGDWPLPGTLLRPVGPGPFPAVVLVHDAGPHDRDESGDGHKPFRDLAEGLASQRIAVLRYEKRTREYWDRFVRLPGATVKDETIDDVVAAVGLLRQVPGVDPQEVFVLGHGLGGMLVPRIAAADSRIAGFVIMAAPTGSIAETMLAQMRRAAGADGIVSSVERSDLAAMTAAVGRIHGLTAADAANPMLIVGAPASVLARSAWLRSASRGQGGRSAPARAAGRAGPAGDHGGLRAVEGRARGPAGRHVPDVPRGSRVHRHPSRLPGVREAVRGSRGRALHCVLGLDDRDCAAGRPD